MNASLGEAYAALLATNLACSTSCSSIILEGDSLLTVITIYQGSTTILRMGFNPNNL